MPSPDLIQRIVEELEEQLAKAKHDALAGGTQAVDTLLLQGEPVSEILRIARDGAFDLIVMGTHSRTGVKHLLIGSVAENVVRLAPCPVLTVRSAPEA